MPEGTESAPGAEVVTTEESEEAEGGEPQAPTQADLDRVSKALEAERKLRRDAEAKSAANAEAAAKIQEIEDATKSETQKLTDKLARSESRNAELEAELIRERVARRHGLTDAQVKRLIGETEEDLDADALELLSMIAPEVEEEDEEEERHAATTPRPALKSGTRPATPLNGDPMLAAVKSKLGIK